MQDLVLNIFGSLALFVGVLAVVLHYGRKHLDEEKKRPLNTLSKC